MKFDQFGFIAAVMGIVPGVLLTGAVAHLRRRRRVTRGAVVMVVAITAVSAAGAVVQLLPGSSPAWLPWATLAVSSAIGYGFLARQLIAQRQAVWSGRGARDGR
ncbi:hypothetical protein [Micromonospora haikouensis]|uniref:hypothetical protein n=1 Tax=Micromonospora haikouensis TaxID=686309 RepID=UPI003D70BC21